MTDQQLAIIIEGLLFVAVEAVTIKHLADVTQSELVQVEMALEKLKQAGQQRGIRLQRHGDKVQLVTAAEISPYIEQFLGGAVSSKLSMPALETLAIVAYRQPITRAEIEAIRGVNSDGVLRNLLSKGLLEEVGRLDTVGHPTVFGTTLEFLRFFGLPELAELPKLEVASRE